MKTICLLSFTISLPLPFFLLCCSICVSAEKADFNEVEVERLQCEYLSTRITSSSLSLKELWEFVSCS